eukprot:TRINITY_DN102987_c0_g1_i1.p1 TRINITY_DN102987_c0_g1~~TRINITY_DN102987_c0_g1_i1.p1  ORF type:complete len:169 (-),score=17.44 TRINITY_DN102987_c0_g1_i1:103-609(-)
MPRRLLFLIWADLKSLAGAQTCDESTVDSNCPMAKCAGPEAMPVGCSMVTRYVLNQGKCCPKLCNYEKNGTACSMIGTICAESSKSDMCPMAGCVGPEASPAGCIFVSRYVINQDGNCCQKLCNFENADGNVCPMLDKVSPSGAAAWHAAVALPLAAFGHGLFWALRC